MLEIGFHLPLGLEAAKHLRPFALQQGRALTSNKILERLPLFAFGPRMLLSASHKSSGLATCDAPGSGEKLWACELGVSLTSVT